MAKWQKFDKISVNTAYKVAQHAFKFHFNSGRIEPSSETGYSEREFRDYVVNEAVTSFYSDVLFEYGKNAEFDYDTVEMMDETEQFKCLTRMVERYIGEKFRPHRTTCNGRRFRSHVGFHEISAVNDEGKKCDFGDIIEDGRDAKDARLVEQKEVLNYQMKRLEDGWYEAIKFILDAVQDGSFNCYFSAGNEMKISRECMELVGADYVNRGHVTVRAQFNRFIEDTRKAYRG